MIKSNNLFKNISLFLCLVPMLLLSLFCFIPKRDEFNVSAFGDQVITNFNFVSSNVVIPISDIIVSNGAVGGTFFNMVNLSFGVTDGVYSASIDGNCNNGVNEFYAVSGRLANVPSDEDLIVSNEFLNAYIFVQPNSYNYVYEIIVSHSGQLTSDIIKVEFSSYVNSSPNVTKPATYYNTITYFDSNGEYMRFEFPLYSSNLNTHLLFDYRVYYFTTSFSDNNYYQAGYVDGYNSGVSDGRELGYENGYNTGVNVGYGVGFNDGVADSQDYSFLALLGAVIDAPVSAFTSLLNFNLLGFNMLAFVTGLITLAVILLIVKLFIGGK